MSPSVHQTKNLSVTFFFQGIIDGPLKVLTSNVQASSRTCQYGRTTHTHTNKHHAHARTHIQTIHHHHHYTNTFTHIHTSLSITVVRITCLFVPSSTYSQVCINPSLCVSPNTAILSQSHFPAHSLPTSPRNDSLWLTVYLHIALDNRCRHTPPLPPQPS